MNKKPAPVKQVPVSLPEDSKIPVPMSPVVSPIGAQKIAMLLPLSGRANDVGEAMLNAAQLAMSDLGVHQFELMPRDTAGTPEIARAVAETSINEGASLILGPLFAEDTKAVAPIAAQKNVNVISFSTDVSAVSNNVFILGFLPQSQIARVLDYAILSGNKNIALIAPRDAYGDTSTRAFDSVMGARGLKPAAIIRYTGAKPLTADIQALKKTTVNAVLIATNGQTANAISEQLSAAGLPASSVIRLGTGLWDQADVARLPALQGAVYAASSPTARARFEARYKDVYGVAPPRLASLGYDAVALAIVQHKSGRGFDKQSLLNPNGFAGVDGIFRFRNDGLNERGLAVMKIENNTARVVQDSPQTFLK